MDNGFTPTGYRVMLTALIDRGYGAVGYAEAEPAERHLILRHDLDMSLEAAEPIAEIEAQLGLRAHYFVLLRTEMYNLFSPAAKRSLEAIRDCGHEIGLHLDASLYDDDPASLDKAAANECIALEVAIGAPVELISFHRPAASLVGYEARLAGRRHAYEPRFVSEMGYCSDSRGAWHYGPPLNHAAVHEGRALQLLTHPIWWTSGDDPDPVVKLERFRHRRDRIVAQALAENCEPYRAVHSEADHNDSGGNLRSSKP